MLVLIDLRSDGSYCSSTLVGGGAGVGNGTATGAGSRVSSTATCFGSLRGSAGRVKGGKI